MNNPHWPIGPFAHPAPPEEVLVADARAHLTPADLVERKYLHLINGSALGGRPLRLAVPGQGLKS